MKFFFIILTLYLCLAGHQAPASTLHLSPIKNFEVIPDPLKSEFNKVYLSTVSLRSKRKINLLEGQSDFLSNEEDRYLQLEVIKKDETFELRLSLKKLLRKELKNKEVLKSDIRASDLVRVMKAAVINAFEEDEKEKKNTSPESVPRSEGSPSNSLQSSKPDSSAIDFRALIEGLKIGTQIAIKETKEKSELSKDEDSKKTITSVASKGTAAGALAKKTDEESLIKKIIKIITPTESALALGWQSRAIASDSLISTSSSASALNVSGNYKKKISLNGDSSWGAEINYYRLMSFPLEASNPYGLRFFFEYDARRLNSALKLFFLRESTFFVNLDSPGTGEKAFGLQLNWYGLDVVVKNFPWHFGIRYLFALDGTSNYALTNNQLTSSSAFDVYLLSPSVWKQLRIKTIYEKRSLEFQGVLPLSHEETRYSVLAYYPF